jgi:hypothetical protein
VDFALVVIPPGSSPADLLLVIEGRAVFSDSMPLPASRSLSLRFSLRACDFEYGVRDASSRSMKSSCLSIRFSFLFKAAW